MSTQSATTTSVAQCPHLAATTTTTTVSEAKCPFASKESDITTLADPIAMAQQRLAERDISGAIGGLRAFMRHNKAHPHAHHVLGDAYYLSEHYELAAHHYSRSLEMETTNVLVQEKLKRTQANIQADIRRAVPAPSWPDPEQILALPTAASAALPPAPGNVRALTCGEGTQRVLATIVGKSATALVRWLSNTVNCVSSPKDRVWTNWYTNCYLASIMKLAHMRSQLNRHNLKYAYPRGSLTGFQPSGQVMPTRAQFYRTADGSWNDPTDPMGGAAGTRFGRNVTFAASWREHHRDMMSPNPIKVSQVLLTREGEMKQVPFLNMLSIAWIQFVTHDWVSHGENSSREYFEIPFPEGHPARTEMHQQTMRVAKTSADPTRCDADVTAKIPPTHVNEVTHWWDGSQIYGSDLATQHRLRSFRHGKMKLDKHNRLPLAADGVADTGLRRNWWVGLELMHTVFVQEHNSICDMLRRRYPTWNDNKLFNVARLINAAVMAKIHTVEWTPAILPNKALNSGMHANWYGLAAMAFEKEENRKTVSNFNIDSPVLGGLVGNKTQLSGVNYSLSEEFVEVYRLHPTLPDNLEIHPVGATITSGSAAKVAEGKAEEKTATVDADDSEIREIPLGASRQAGAHAMVAEHGIAELLNSFGKQSPGQLVLNNFPKTLQHLSVAGQPFFDLGAVDILRCRERGVPRYNEMRRQLGLNPITSFEDLVEGSPDAEAQVAKLRSVYEDIEDIDLLIGTLAEARRPTGFGFGETLFQVFILNASRRLAGDRFFTESYNEATYTKEGLEWVDRTTFKSLILRHFPALGDSDLAKLDNAFEPWDASGTEDASRHPLSHM